jgi:hypothetical protein
VRNLIRRFKQYIEEEVNEEDIVEIKEVERLPKGTQVLKE